MTETQCKSFIKYIRAYVKEQEAKERYIRVSTAMRKARHDAEEIGIDTSLSSYGKDPRWVEVETGTFFTSGVRESAQVYKRGEEVMLYAPVERGIAFVERETKR